MKRKILFALLFITITKLHAQNVGIGTTSPLTKLHVSNGLSGNGNTNANRLITFEAASSSYIQLLNPTASESGILAGNTTSLIKSGIVFKADSSIDFRTGTNTSRMLINKIGFTAIGNVDPQAKLHVSNSIPVPGAQFGSSFSTAAIFESGIFGSSSLQLMNQSGFDFRIMSGTDLIQQRSGINFGADSSLVFETGGINPRLKIDKIGEVEVGYRLGIGNTSPQVRLHVNTAGTLINAQYGPSFSTSAIFESNIIGTSSIQLMNSSNHDFKLISGTDLILQRSGINFKADSSINFETGGLTPNMRIDKTGEVEILGRLGIANSSPQARFHVTNGLAVSNAQYASSFGNAAIFESGIFGVSTIQLMNSSNHDFKIVSGTDLMLQRSGINFDSDSSISFETGGQTPRMKIDKSGEVEVSHRIGIGNTSPQTRLHVSAGTLAEAQYNSSTTTPMIIETSISGLANVQLMNSSNHDFKIVSGTELLSQRSGINFKADSSLAFETGGLNPRMRVSKLGVVDIPNSLGIGTTTPSASLDVSGTAVLGVNGTVLTEVIKVTVTKDVATISAGASGIETFAVTNAQLNSTVYVSPASAFSDGLIIAYARVSIAGTVEVKFTNITGAAINPAAMNFFITVIR